MNLVNVSKWFDELQYLEPDYIVAIDIQKDCNNEFGFLVTMIDTSYYSKSYPTKQDCEFAMEEFIKCLERG